MFIYTAHKMYSTSTTIDMSLQEKSLSCANAMY
jgi:hypothetical protein